MQSVCWMSNLKGIKMKSIWHLQIQIYLSKELQLSVHTNTHSGYLGRSSPEIHTKLL